MKPPAEVKAQLLAHYATKEPSRFVQIDCHTNRTGSGLEDLFEPWEDAYDEDGDQIGAWSTTELMHGAPVRVFIRPETSAATAVRVLDKVVAWLRRRPSLIAELVGPPPPPAPDYTGRELNILEAIAENVAARDHISFERALVEVKELAEKGYRKECPF
jgi:hypothetical protein